MPSRLYQFLFQFSFDMFLGIKSESRTQPGNLRCGNRHLPALLGHTRLWLDASTKPCRAWAAETEPKRREF